MDAHSLTHSYTHIHPHIHPHPSSHIHTHTYTHTRRGTHTHTHTHTSGFTNLVFLLNAFPRLHGRLVMLLAGLQSRNVHLQRYCLDRVGTVNRIPGFQGFHVECFTLVHLLLVHVYKTLQNIKHTKAGGREREMRRGHTLHHTVELFLTYPRPAKDMASASLFNGVGVVFTSVIPASTASVSFFSAVLRSLACNAFIPAMKQDST
jgi:hypothetical protein